MKLLSSTIIITCLQSCSLFHQPENFEMERLSQDVLKNKSGEGISIEITPILTPKGKQ